MTLSEFDRRIDSLNKLNVPGSTVDAAVHVHDTLETCRALITTFTKEEPTIEQLIEIYDRIEERRKELLQEEEEEDY